MHPNKRRCLNASMNVLSKPFRSPLREKSKNHLPLNTQTGFEEHSESAASPRDETLSLPSAGQSLSAIDLKTAVDDVDKLQREYSALCQQLRRHREYLDTLQQAYKIRHGKQKEKVDELITKWKSICRDVADNLFESTSKQIQNMGGIQVWQQQAVQMPDTEWYDLKEDHSSQPVSEAHASDVDNLNRDHEQSLTDMPVSSNDVGISFT